MSTPADFLPTAAIQTLMVRARLLQWTRAWFFDHGYWEVQTPILSRDVCVDTWLEPFPVPTGCAPGQTAEVSYLQTSPEFAMKRLLVAGADAIVQIGPVFRQEEIGPLHNPEFTMVEWYKVGTTYEDQMDFTESFVKGFVELARTLINADGPELPSSYTRLTYDDAFAQACGTAVLDLSSQAIRELAAAFNVEPPASLREEDRDGWLNLLLAEVVEPTLQEERAVFLHDYPASQAALSRIRHDVPPVAERFELYLGGIEICNGYQELTDADELRRRIQVQSQRRAAEGLPPLPTDSRLLMAMDAGLPECSGVALGFDRLLMVALGRSNIGEVIPFPWDRA